MATDYNARLIAELYATEDAEHATRISDEMVSVGDDIFPRQIYEAYKKFKNSFVSHYFVTDLVLFNTIESGEFLKEIARGTTKNSDIAMMVEYLADAGVFEPGIVAKVWKTFEEDIGDKQIYEFEVERYFDYFKKEGKEIDRLEILLKSLFEDDGQDMSARRTALKKLLKLKPKEYIRHYYESYDEIKGKRTEIIFVQEMSTWHGGIVPALHAKILASGSARAKEILKEQQLKEENENKAREITEQKEVKSEYETADVIGDIASLRSKINKVSAINDKFGFQFFTPIEDIYQQNKPAKDKVSLIGYCMVLRPMLGAFSDRVSGFEITTERIAELLPDLKNSSGTINKFHLLLLEKQINVDRGIFGLRNLNRLITKFAAHTNEENSTELYEILREEGLFDLYAADEWSKLHREILIKYRKFLVALLDAISVKEDPDVSGRS